MTTPAGTATGTAGPSGGTATFMTNVDPQSPTSAVTAAETNPPQTLVDGSSSDIYRAAPTT